MKLFPYVKVLSGKVENKIRMYISSRICIDVSKPQVIYYLMNNICNYRCIFCKHWKMGRNDSNKKYVSTEIMKDIIEQASKWKIYNFGISGGEPLLFRKKLFELLEFANRKGIYTHFGSNGFLINKDVFQHYEDIGGGHISLSIDGSSSKTHDGLRGFKGAFDNCCRVLDTYGSLNLKKTNLKINTIINKQNINEIQGIVNLAIKVNASIFVGPYDPYNWDNRNKLSWEGYTENYPLWIDRKNFSKLKMVIEGLSQTRKVEPSLVLNPREYLLDIPKYYNRTLNKSCCIIGYHSLVILPHGEINMCKYGHIASLYEEQNIKNIWRSRTYQKIRQDSYSCKYGCMLGCMYDPTLVEWVKTGYDYIKKKNKKKLKNNRTCSLN